MAESDSPKKPAKACTGPCRKKQPPVGEMSAGAAILGLALLAGCPPDLGGDVQPLYGVPVDDDDSAEVDDDDSAFDDDDADQPLYGVPG